MSTIQLKLLVLAALCTLASSSAVLRRTTNTGIPAASVHTDTNQLGNHNTNNAQEGSDRFFELGRYNHPYLPRNSDDTNVQIGTGGMGYHTHSERPDSNGQSYGPITDAVRAYWIRQETKGAPEVESNLDLTPEGNNADSNKL